MQWKVFSDIREVRRLFKTWTIVVDSRRNQVSRAESEFLEPKQSPFRFDASCRNRVLRQQSRIQSRFSIRFSRGSRIECQLSLNGTAVQMTCRFRLGRRMPNYRVSNYRVLDGRSAFGEGNVQLQNSDQIYSNEENQVTCIKAYFEFVTVRLSR